MSGIVSTPSKPEPIQRAAAALESLLMGDLPIEVRIRLERALAVLYDVHPPHPPHRAPGATLELQTGLAMVRQALAEAVRGATNPQEAIRAGMAGRELRSLPQALS
jgi:hypothetical protein